MPVRVLHLTGSPTSAFWAELSRVYAADCLAVTASMPDVEPVVAWIEPGGGWRFPADLSEAATSTAPVHTLAEALARIEAEAVDVMVPQLFCRAGMTDLRALFDVAAIPYPGNTAAVMALGADKAHTRAVVAAAGVAVPEAVVVGGADIPQVVFPVVVKPVDADNSAGVSLVRDADALGPAVDAARRHGADVLIEQYVPAGREVRCGVLELGGEVVALPLEEYRLDADMPIRGADEKLAEAESGGLQLVAKTQDRAWIVPDTDLIVPAVQEAALRAYAAMGCRDYGLFDFRIDPDGRPWFIEAGLYCSFAEQSVISVMARASGWATSGLFRACISAALDRHRE